jgi:flagellar biosynthesis/type III secretory pathway M-ring protein FliF/YscJ
VAYINLSGIRADQSEEPAERSREWVVEKGRFFMDNPLVIVLVVIAVIVMAAAIYWMTRGKSRRLEQQRERAADHREQAQGAAQRAGEADLAARRNAEEAEREREHAVELEHKAAETDPDQPR